jgi:hypothetical protein
MKGRYGKFIFKRKKKSCIAYVAWEREKKNKNKKHSTPERFELSRGNPMYLAGTRLNHSAKASLLSCDWYISL